MKKNYLLILSLAVTFCQMQLFAQPRTFVKTVDNNADIYFMPDVDNPSDIRRLTTDAGIDNHPDMYIMQVPPYDTLVVWSSNRTGNFELFIGALPDLESPVPVQITSNNYSDRHPHFSMDGQLIVYTSKYRFEPSIQCPQSECSIPVNVPCGWYEGLHVINTSTLTIYEFDFRNMAIVGVGNWPQHFATWIGHPSFSPTDDRIIFSASPDSSSDDWEVYSIAFIAPDSISDLRQHTLGTLYPNCPNPIKMSAGAEYINNGTEIIYSSTRTPLGNSQIFKIPATSLAVPVSPVNQLTWNYGNDYVPEELSDSRLFITSDLGINPICPPPDSGASADLDVWIMNPDGSGRINITNNDTANEMLLIGDEVSWFCGLKPNLSECTVYPKIYNVCWWREFYNMGTNPSYLPWFPKRAQYTQMFQTIMTYFNQNDPQYLSDLMSDMFYYSAACDTSWMTVPSWWIIPSIFGKWDTTKPANPALIAPPNKSITDSIMIHLDWTDIPGATSYGVQVDDSPSFTSPIFQVGGQALSEHDISLPDGLYYWRASATNVYGTTWSTVWYFNVLYSGVNEFGTAREGNFLTVHPNPANSSTIISYEIPSNKNVKISIYDVKGAEIVVLQNDAVKSGRYSLQWDAGDYPQGVYYITMISGDYVQTQKLILIK